MIAEPIDPPVRATCASGLRVWASTSAVTSRAAAASARACLSGWTTTRARHSRGRRPGGALPRRGLRGRGLLRRGLAWPWPSSPRPSSRSSPWTSSPWPSSPWPSSPWPRFAVAVVAVADFVAVRGRSSAVAFFRALSACFSRGVRLPASLRAVAARTSSVSACSGAGGAAIMALASCADSSRPRRAARRRDSAGSGALPALAAAAAVRRTGWRAPRPCRSASS